MLIEVIPVGPFQCNCIILGDEATREGVIIDPGDEAQRIMEVVRANGLKITHILHTHGHLDHIGATAAVHRETGAPILIHQEDLWLYDNLKMQGDLFGLKTEPVIPVQQFLQEGDVFVFGTQKTSTLHTPGHTPGSVTFSLDIDGKPKPLLVSGDTLFQGSIGRTDLWGGSYEKIIQSIQQKLLPLHEETRVIPGHGPETTIWQEKRNNPFLQ